MCSRADTPTPEFVGNSRVRGARSPPGTHRDLTTPSRAHLGPAAGHTDRPPDFARAKWESAACADFTRANSESPVPGWTFAGQSGEVCRPPDFPRAKWESVTGRPSGRRFRRQVFGRRCARPAKKTVFFRPLRACIRKRGPLFPKKEVDFPARQSDVCPRRAGNRQKAQTGRAGEAAAGRKEHAP